MTDSTGITEIMKRSEKEKTNEPDKYLSGSNFAN